MRIPDNTYKLEWDENYYTVKSAAASAVTEVLDSKISDPDGRSQWVWVRLPDGDLILGIFPQGATYEGTQRDHP